MSRRRPQPTKRTAKRPALGTVVAGEPTPRGTATAPPRRRFFGDVWTPLSTQAAFMKASFLYRYLLYGGSRGSGKSALLRWGAVYRLMEWAQRGVPGVRVGLFSEDYPTLKDRQISKIEREFPRWLGELKDTQTDGLGFYLAEEYGGGVLLLRNLDDPSKYVGGEFAGVAVEELTRLPKETFDTLRGSIRWPGLEDTFFWAATNPLGVGLLWVRGLWIERNFPPELQALAPQFHYVRALPTDNPHLTPDYWADLRSQPPHIQRAWIDGDWYIPVGVMFEELRKEVHQVGDEPLAGDSIIEVAADWGYEHMAVALWVETRYVTRHRLTHRVFREYVTHRMSPIDWANEVVRRSGKERIARVVLDSAAWNRAQDGASSPAEQMVHVFLKAGIPFQPVEKRGTSERNSRVHGWHLLHEYFKVREGGPMLAVAESCPVLWSQLTTLVRGEPPEDIEDTAPGQVDDAATALRYFVMMRPTHPWLAPEQPKQDPDAHPGLDETGRRAKRWYDRRPLVEPVGGRFIPRGPLVALDDL